MRRLRILFYAVNGLGLGHVSRLLAIARAVRRLRPETECLFLTASEADWIIYREGFASFKVPSRTARAAAGLTPALYARTVQNVTWTLVTAFDPHVLVVDTFPAGTMQELLPLLRWPINKVFVFREQRPQMATDAYLQEILRLYQLIIVPHAAGDVDLPLPEGVPASWTGPILLREREEALTRSTAEQRLRLPPGEGKPRLYINFGGGGDPEALQLSQLAVAAAELVPELDPVVAPGPLARDDWQLPARVAVVHHHPMAECLAAFDMALSAAGYNAVHELLHHGVPAVLAPVNKGVDDQEARARRAVLAGAAIDVQGKGPEPIAHALRRLLDGDLRETISRAGKAVVPGGGAEAAAQAILNL